MALPTNIIFALLLLVAISVEQTRSQADVVLWQETFADDVGYGIGVGLVPANASVNGWSAHKAKSSVAEQAVFGVS